MLRAHLNRVCAAFVLLLMTAPAFAGVGKVMFVLGGASIERGQSAIAAQTRLRCARSMVVPRLESARRSKSDHDPVVLEQRHS